jgi:FG-GAP repeat
MMLPIPIIVALLSANPPPQASHNLAADLRPPTHVRVGGQPLDVERSAHAAPFVGDFDGDGTPDLLVGQFHNGALRIYPGKGGSAERTFGDYFWFQAGGKPGRIPAG